MGLPDEEQGSVPVAVVKLDGITRTAKSALAESVASSLGKEYCLTQIYTLQELGLQNFPVNASGKIARRELLQIILGLDE